MGKSKKTRWRTFEISGSQDETQKNGANVKDNETHSDPHAPLSTQKNLQVRGDHLTNNSTNQFNKNSSNYIYKPRGFNNKENFNNQRSGARSALQQRSWQRGGIYRTSTSDDKSKKVEDNGVSHVKVDSTAEPIKFNEDEYTRITTPRQDVLFKKSYLSRMNNKTATNLSATVNSTESTAASSTITTSDPDSSVSTLSPATTPSMDFGQPDSMDYGQMYYPDYYDGNGMMVIPMYNGYNYYPQDGSSSTSPIFVMPYPYQYDPFFMTPGSLQPVDGEESVEEMTETDGSKENNQHAENKNGTRSTTNSSDSASSTHGEEGEDEKKESAELIGTENVDENNLNETNNPNEKPSFPIYPNAYPNGYYNNFYYYNNGPPSSRPQKMKRRKRFTSSRNSQQQTPRSAETTTDYSDDDNVSQNKGFHSRFQNGWGHYNGNYHHNASSRRAHMDRYTNQTPKEFHLNVDVQEFHPRVVHSSNSEPETKANYDDERSSDLPSLQSETVTSRKQKNHQAHLSKTSSGKVSKKEIIEGIKSMEQQNIDLMATKPHATQNKSQDDEWNVIKKGKKVKVVKNVKIELSSSDMQEVKQDKKEENKIEGLQTIIAVPEAAKKSMPAPKIVKKMKSKGKKKKTHLLTKQDGFEIIEPEFNNEKEELNEFEETADITQGINDEEEIIEQEILTDSVTRDCKIIETVALKAVEAEIHPEVTTEQEVIDENVIQASENAEEKKQDSILQRMFKDVENVVIDVSDEDNYCKVNETSLALESQQELVINSVFVGSETGVQHNSEPELETKIEREAHENVGIERNIEENRGLTVKQEASKRLVLGTKIDNFQDMDFFNDDINIETLERDLMENLRLLDDEIELKSPIINPLYDFPITSAVQKWLQEKQNESFDSLFHVQNLKKLNELFEDDDNETESDISEKELKSESDSDYASDFQTKTNGSSPICSSQAKPSSDKISKCNKIIAAKESFCALM